jgi:hypothetical protein
VLDPLTEPQRAAWLTRFSADFLAALGAASARLWAAPVISARTRGIASSTISTTPARRPGALALRRSRDRLPVPPTTDMNRPHPSTLTRVLLPVAIAQLAACCQVVGWPPTDSAAPEVISTTLDDLVVGVR